MWEPGSGPTAWVLGALPGVWALSNLHHGIPVSARRPQTAEHGGRVDSSRATSWASSHTLGPRCGPRRALHPSGLAPSGPVGCPTPADGGGVAAGEEEPVAFLTLGQALIS